jgi:hypothetical protein
MDATRYFALALGVAYVGARIAGFVPGLLAAPEPDDPPLTITAAHGRLFGIFPVNVLHNLVHLAIGAWGIAAYRRFDAARVFARGIAIIYGLFAVMGLFPVLKTTFGLVPIHGHDVWLHALSALGGVYFGWFNPAGRAAAETSRP